MRIAIVAAAAILAPATALHAQVTATVRVTVRAAVATPPGRAPAVALRAVTVAVRSGGLAASTDAHGVAILRGLAPGRHALVVSALGFADATVEVEAVNGWVARASVVLEPAPVPIRGLDVRVASGEGATRGTVVETASLPPGVADLPAALDRVPGATVVRQGGPGAPAVVQLRGSGGDQVLVLVDGTAINSPLTGVADLSTVDLEAIARIVVIPGAQSARYGPRALGGVVLLESRAAGAASGSATSGMGAWSSAEVAVSGSRAFGSRAAASPPGGRGASGDGWSISGGARWRRSDGAFTYDVPDFRGGGESTRENAAFTQAGGDVGIARRGRMTTSLRAHLGGVERGSPGAIGQPSLSGRQQHRRWGLSAQIAAAEPSAPDRSRLGGAESSAPGRSRSGGADSTAMGRSQPGGTESSVTGRSRMGGSVRAGVHWQRAEYADPSPPFGRAYDTRTRVRRAELALESWWSWGMPSSWRTDAPTPRRATTPTLRLGLHAARLDVESCALTSPTVGLDELGAWARAGRGWELGRGVRLDLGAAIRADRHDLVDGVTASPAVDAALTRAGLTLDLRWGRGFSPPGLGDLFFQEGVLVEPNPDLRPERIRGELTASVAQRWSLGAAAGELRATAYRADLDDMILWFPDHRFVWSPDNYDVARRGFELGATTDLTAFGAANSVTANAAWSEVEYTGAVLDGQVAYRPRFTADLSLSIGLPAGITLTPSGTHVGERRTVPGSPLNALGGYTLFDAGVAIPFALARRTGRLDLALANLLDKRAALLADYPLPGRAWSIRIRIGAGR